MQQNIHFGALYFHLSTREGFVLEFVFVDIIFLSSFICGVKEERKTMQKERRKARG